MADGAAVLRAHPQELRLVGADIICSLVYGMQTVLLIAVADRAGLGLHGYGYLLRRTLPPDVFGRAYGLALPASLAGIVVGSLIAPLLTSLLGGTGALVACGGAAIAYGVLLSAPRRQPRALLARAS